MESASLLMLTDPDYVPPLKAVLDKTDPTVTLAFQSVMRLFERLAPALADSEKQLTPNGEAWRGKSRRKADFLKLCELPVDVSEAEFLRRYRAVGEGPDHALSISIFGHRFKLDNQRSNEAIFRGGQRSQS